MSGNTDHLRLSHLRALEAESIHILREVAGEFAQPAMLQAIGRDSSVMLSLARSTPRSCRKARCIG